jgi:aldehyde decarbonylase
MVLITTALSAQANELNRNGELYVIRKPNLKTKIVDGASLAVAAVLHMIPPGTKDVLFLGDASKVTTVLASALCEQEIQVPDRETHYMITMILQFAMFYSLSCMTLIILWSKQVQMVDKDLHDCLTQELRPELHKHLLVSSSYSSKVTTSSVVVFLTLLYGWVVTSHSSCHSMSSSKW